LTFQIHLRIFEEFLNSWFFNSSFSIKNYFESWWPNV